MLKTHSLFIVLFLFAGIPSCDSRRGPSQAVPPTSVSTPPIESTHTPPPVGGSTETPQQVPPPPPPREFRAAWVATVANIDWPSAPGLPAAKQQEELRNIISTAASLNLNALIVQVRPTADAMYVSDLEPWSEYLSGQSGKGPDPAYDPLEVWVSECHAAAIECHVWFNPFRTRHFKATGPDAPMHINNARKDLVHEYDRYWWMDPGEQDAQDHSIRVMLDVVSRYDIDGIHMDDYFYPYPKRGHDFPDDASWAKYTAGGGTLSRADWRRDNINRFVRRLYEEAKRIKPHIRVGISPFGIWQPGHPEGVEGFNAYAGLYADAALWMREGWLDYASPQLYWRRSAPKQPFEPLLDWWLSQSTAGRPVYPGLYTSKCDPADGKWPSSEITNQILSIRTRQGTGGEIHFSMKALQRNYAGIADALRTGPYAEPAIPPECASCGEASVPVLEVRAVFNADRTILEWSPPPGTYRAVAAWKTHDSWSYRPIPTAAGGVHLPSAQTAAAALIAPNGKLGSWTVVVP